MVRREGAAVRANGHFGGTATGSRSSEGFRAGTLLLLFAAQMLPGSPAPPGWFKRGFRMCTVMGTLAAMPRETFERSLARTHTRGPMRSRAAAAAAGFRGFSAGYLGSGESARRSFGPHTAVCNGELYGFRAQKRALQAKGYSFRSGSDCEVLLPLYLEYGLAMFARLDAEFACILYDGARHRLIAARDPIGIRPLFYGYWKGEAVFASEAKNLVGLVDEVRPFPPGHYYADGVFTPYCDITAARPHLADAEEEAGCAIRKKLLPPWKSGWMQMHRWAFCFRAGWTVR